MHAPRGAARPLFLALVAGLVTLSPARGAAVSSGAGFATLRAKTTLVALGTLLRSPTGWTLDVDTVVSGQAAGGRRVVTAPPDGAIDLPSGTRVVAFLDGGVLRWVGRLLAGPSLETGVLRIQGPSALDLNVVSPSVMSLSELTAALATGRLVQTFRGHLVFPDGSGGQVRSAKQLTVSYDAVADKLQSASGLTLACLGAPTLEGVSWGALRIDYHDTCPSTAPGARPRELQLTGRFLGWDPTASTVDVELAVASPLVGEADFDTFAADGSLATVRRVVSVALSGGSRWTWDVGARLVDSGGQEHKGSGTSLSLEIKNGVTTSRGVYDFGGPSIAIEGVGGGLVPAVEGGAITACTLTLAGAKQTCRLRSEAPIFLKR